MVLVAASCEKTKTKSSNSSNPQPFAPKSLDDLTGTVWFSDNGSSQLILHFKGRSSSEQEDYPYYLSYYQLTSDDRIRTQYTCGVTKLKEGSVFFITNKMELAPSGAVNSTFSYEGRLDGEKMELYQAGTSTGLIFELRRDLEEGAEPVPAVSVIPIRGMHDQLPVLGFRFGDIAYITDMSSIDDSELEKLKGLRHLTLNTVGYVHHHSHFSLDEAIALAGRIGAEHTWLTHLSHTFPPHAEFAEILRERTGGSILPAYDGLMIE